MDPEGPKRWRASEERSESECRSGAVWPASEGTGHRHRTGQNEGQLTEAYHRTQQWVDEIFIAGAGGSQANRGAFQGSFCQPQNVQGDPGPPYVSQEDQDYNADPARMLQKGSKCQALQKGSGDSRTETAKRPTTSTESGSRPLPQLKMKGSKAASENLVAIHSNAIRRDFAKIPCASASLAEKMLQIHQFEVRIPNTVQFSKEEIVQKLNEKLQEPIPCRFLRYEGADIVFNVPCMAHKVVCQQLSDKLTLPDGRKMLILTKAVIPSLEMEDSICCMELKDVLTNRYDPQMKRMDLTCLYADDTFNLVGWDFRLNRAETVGRLVDMISKDFKEVESLDLSYNEIKSLSLFAPLVRSTPHVAHLNLAYNRLESMDELDEIRGWKLRELVLKENPLQKEIADATTYARIMRRKFRTLLFLDDLTLPWLENDRKVPAVQHNFFLNHDIRGHLVGFLDAFFRALDSENRDILRNAYHKKGVLRVVMVQNPGIDKHCQQSLHMYSQTDRAVKVQQAEGQRDIAALYCSFPPTQHIFSSMRVDVGCASHLQLFVTVTGLFTEDKSGRPSVKCFTKTIQCQHHKGTFNMIITNETLTITNPLPEHRDKAHLAHGFALPSSAASSSGSSSLSHTEVAVGPPALPTLSSSRAAMGPPTLPFTSRKVAVSASPEVPSASVGNVASTTVKAHAARLAALILHYLFQEDVFPQMQTLNPPCTESLAPPSSNTASAPADLPTTTCSIVTAPPDASISSSSPAVADAGLPSISGSKAESAWSYSPSSTCGYPDYSVYSCPSSPSIFSSPIPKRQRKASTASTSCLESDIAPTSNLASPAISKRLFSAATPKPHQQSSTPSKSLQSLTPTHHLQSSTPTKGLQSSTFKECLLSSSPSSRSHSWLDEHPAQTSGGVFACPTAKPKQSQQSPSPTQSQQYAGTPRESQRSPTQSLHSATDQLSVARPTKSQPSPTSILSWHSWDSDTQSEGSPASSTISPPRLEEHSAQTFGGVFADPHSFSPETLRKLSPTYVRPASAPPFLYSWSPSAPESFGCDHPSSSGNLISMDLLHVHAAQALLAPATSFYESDPHVLQGTNQSPSSFSWFGSVSSFSSCGFGPASLRDMMHEPPSDTESLLRTGKKWPKRPCSNWETDLAQAGQKPAPPASPSIYHSDSAAPSEGSVLLDVCGDAYSPPWRPKKLPKASGSNVNVESTMTVSKGQAIAASPGRTVPSSPQSSLMSKARGSCCTRDLTPCSKLSTSDSGSFRPLTPIRREQSLLPSSADVEDVSIPATTVSTSMRPGTSSRATPRASTSAATFPKPSTPLRVSPRIGSGHGFAQASSFSSAASPRATTSGAPRGRGAKGVVCPPSPGFRSQLRLGNIPLVSDEPLARPSEYFDYHSLSKSRQMLVCHVVAISGLKKEWAAQCLVQCDWDFGAAALYIEKMNSEGGFPHEAFLFSPQ